MMKMMRFVNIGQLCEGRANKLACAFMLFTMMLLLVPVSAQAQTGNLKWNATTGTWDYVTKNWSYDGDPAAFSSGDYAIFDESGTYTITIVTDITTSGMQITDGNYTFTGNFTITGDSSISGSAGHTTGGILRLDTTGTTTINVATNFQGGNILSTGTLVIGNDKALGEYGGNAANAEYVQGQLNITGLAAIQVLENRTLKNRFVFSNGGLTIADGAVLNITGVNNTATDPIRATGGAIFAAQALTISGGTLQITGNSTSAGSGGGIYATTSLDLSDLAAVSFTNNKADSGQGGALYIGRNLTLAGNVAFTGNTAASGGAIYMAGANSTSNTLTLGTSAGHILFSGNTGSGVYLNKDVAVSITGNNNVYFNDATGLASGSAGGNSLTKTGAGMVLFKGANVLNTASGTGGAVAVNNGIFRVENGASFSNLGTGSTFNLATGSTLSGGGSLASGTFTLAGIISPDSDTFTIPTNIGSTTASVGNQTAADSNYIGTLTITGNVTFNSATMKVDLAASNSSDRLAITGAATVSASNKNTVDISSFVLGRYLIMSASGAGFTLDAFNNVTMNSQALSPRIGYATISVENSNKDVYLTLAQRTGVYKIQWSGTSTPTGSGTVSNTWNTGNINWMHTYQSTNYYDNFQNGDYAIFAGLGQGSVSVLSTGVNVSGMDIETGTYSFTGGAITSSGSSESGATNRLEVFSGATANFANAVSFTGGMVIQNNANVTLNKTTAAAGFGDAMAISNAGALTFNVGSAYVYEQKGLISGAGTVTKTGTGALTLTGNHEGSLFTQTTGIVNLNDRWTGNYVQSSTAGDLVAANGSSIVGNATFASGVNLQGTEIGNQLNITGNMTFNNANLKVAIDEDKTTADNIKVTSVANFSDTGTVTIKEWQVGKYVLINAASFNYTGSGSTSTVFDDYTIALSSGALTKRQSAVLSVESGSGTNLVLTTSITNAQLYWVSGTNTWNTATTPILWNDTIATGAANDYFMNNDYVTFTSSSAGTITVAEAVTVSGMRITGGTQTFSGASGSITGTNTVAANSGFTATNELLVEAGTANFGVPTNFNTLKVTGGTINFSSTGTFAGGVSVTGGILRINNNGNLTSSAINVASPGYLYYSMTTGEYTQNGNLSGNGTVFKNGAGTLNLRGNIEATGSFQHSAGIVNLESSWKGAYAQSGATSVLNTSANASIAGNYTQSNTAATLNAGQNTSIGGTATLTGQININGTSTGSMSTNSLHLNGATLNITVAASNASDRIAVTGAVTFGNASTIKVSDWISGTYTLITSANMASIADKFNAIEVTGGGVRDGYSLYVLNNNLMLEITTGGALALVWNGAGQSDAWNTVTTNTNWLSGSTNTAFINNDSVSFIDNGAAGEVVLGQNVTVTKMTVSGGVYNFDGAYTIAGTGSAAGENTLIVSGDAQATFKNSAVSFTNMQITANAEVTLDNSERNTTFGSTKIDNQGTLIYDLTQNYTQDGNLVNTGGTIVKWGDATLTLKGSIDSNAASEILHHEGTVDLQTDWTGSYGQSAGTLVTTGNRVISGETSLSGTVQVGGTSVAQLQTGALTLAGAKLSITIAATNSYDTIASSGALTINGVNTIDVSQFLAGTYTIITSASTVGSVAGKFGAVTINGNALTGRQAASVTNSGSNLLLTLSSSGNLSIVWAGTGTAGSTGGLWNITNANWTSGNLFVQSDFVTFDSTAANKTVDVFATGASVAGMNVTGGNYVFRGGAIAGVSTANGVTATNTLTVSGTGTTAEFQNAITFGNINITTGAAAKVSVSAAGTGKINGTVNVGSGSSLTYEIANGYGYTQSTALTNSGTVIKTGAGTLTLTGAIGGTSGTFRQDAGTVILGANVSGTYNQTAGILNVTTTRTVGALSLADTLNMVGSGTTTLTVTGNLTLNKATLMFDTATSNAADRITVQGNVVASSGQNTNTVAFSSWVGGNYTLISSSSALSLDSFGVLASTTAAPNARDYRARLYLGNSDTSLMLEILDGTGQTNNRKLVWDGGIVANTTGVWDEATTGMNWGAYQSTETSRFNFVDGDYVAFVNGKGVSAVTLDDDVVVSGMVVENGEFVFSGGAIDGSGQAEGIWIKDASEDFTTNQLYIAGGKATFNNNVSFVNASGAGLWVNNGEAVFNGQFTFNDTRSGYYDMLIGANGIVTINNDAANGATSNAALISNDGRLNFNLTKNFTQSGAIGGTGDVYKTGAATLTLGSNNTGTGAFNQQAGNVVLQYNWSGAYTQTTGSLTTGSASTLGSYSANGGTLAINGANTGMMYVGDSLTFNGTSWDVTLTSTGNDKISIGTTSTGSLITTGTTAITISSFVAGTHDLVTVQSGGAIDLGKFTLAGLTLTGRQYATLQTSIGAAGQASKLQVAMGTQSLALTWQGNSANWSTADMWISGGSNQTFAANDKVIFTATNAGTVTVGSAVTVAGMEVTGGTYIFTGSKINGGGTATGPNGATLTTNQLVVSGGDVTFRNEIEFSQGMNIGASGNVTLDKANSSSTAAFTNTAITNAGTLTYSIGDNAGYTQNGNLNTNGGTVVKTGAGSLTLTGSITSNASSKFTHSAGEVVLNTNWAGSYNLASGATLTANTAQTIGGATTLAGTVDMSGNGVTTLTINSAVTLSGAAFDFDLAAGSTNDNLVINGAVSSTANSTINVNGNLSGTYTLMTANSGLTTNMFGNTVLVNGSAISPREGSYSLAVANVGGKQELQLTLTLGANNMTLVWDGAASPANTWNYATTPENWLDSNSLTDRYYFVAGDYAVFTATYGSKAVNISDTVNGVLTSGMEITGGQYTFTGGAIKSTDEAGGLTPTEQLKVSGTGTTARFENAVDFAKGATVSDNAAVTFAGATTLGGTGLTIGSAASAAVERASGASTTAFAVSNAGNLTYNINGSANLTHSGVISGAGTVTKTGAGTLTLTAANTATGAFTQSAGAVVLNSNWAGAYTQAAGAGTFTAGNGATISGAATFNGTVVLNGANIATLNVGSLSLSGSTVLQYTLGASNASDLIAVTGAVTSNDTATINISGWQVGTYQLITATSGLNAANFTITGGLTTPTDRQTQILSVVDSGNTLQLAMEQRNLNLTWKGGDAAWGAADKWTYNSNDQTFADGDAVTFTAANAGDVTVAADVAVAGMKVTGGTYVWEGAGAISTTNSVDGSVVTPTQKLEVSGSSTDATFNNNINFANGAAVTDGASLTIGGTAGFGTAGLSIDADSSAILDNSVNANATLGSTVINNDGTFVFYADSAMTHAGTINGNAGSTVVKNAAGTLTLEGTYNTAGTFDHWAGAVVLNSNWAGNYEQATAGTTLTSTKAIGGNYQHTQGIYNANTGSSVTGTYTQGANATLNANGGSLGAAQLGGTTALGTGTLATGSLVLNGATLQITTAANDASGKITTGSLSFTGGSGVNTIEVTNWASGEYAIIVSTANITNITDMFTATLAGGATLSDRQTFAFNIVNNNTVVMTLNSAASYNMTWAGPNNANGALWNSADANWDNGSDLITFASGDYAIFDDTAYNKDVTVVNAVSVSGMEITGADYTFAGAKITGSMVTANGQTVTGKLNIDDATATFNNDVEFERGAALTDANVTFAGVTTLGNAANAGLSIDADSTATVNNSANSNATMGSTAIRNEGSFTFAAGNDMSYAGVISGAGEVNKTGAGVLTLSGVNTATGVFKQSAGDVTISNTGAWAGGYTQTAGNMTNDGTLASYTLTSGNMTNNATVSGNYLHNGGIFTAANGSTVGGNYTQASGATLNANGGTFNSAALSGGITNIDGTGIGQMQTSTLTLNGATLNITMGAAGSDNSDSIFASNGITLGATANSILLSGFVVGEYTILYGGTGGISDGSTQLTTADIQSLFTAGLQSGSLTSRQNVTFSIVSGNVVMELSETASLSLQWNGKTGSSAWNTTATNKNWLNTDESPMTNESFEQGDSVIFTVDAEVKDVTVEVPVVVGGMSVTGGAYTFTGSAITGDSGVNLAVSGTDTTVAFNNDAVTFAGGMTVGDNAYVTITTAADFGTNAGLVIGSNATVKLDKATATSDAALNDTKINNAGTLIYTLGDGVTYTATSAISGAGMVEKQGQGTLTLSGAYTDADSKFVQSVGDVVLGSDWAGSYTQNAGTLTTNGDRAIGGAAVLKGAVQIGGTSVGTLNVGSLELDGANITVTISGTNADKIVTAGLISFGADKSTINAVWTEGDYLIIDGGAASGLTTASIENNFNPLNISGVTNTKRQLSELVVEGDDLFLSMTFANLTVTWDGSNDDVWENAAGNWEESGDGEDFYAGDNVIFDNNTSGNVVVDAAGVDVADMDVTGGDHTFTGPGVINGEDLTVSGGVANFETEGNFSNGVAVDGGQLVITNDGDTSNGGLATPEIAVNGSGELIYDINESPAYPENKYSERADITGDGNVTKIGDGLLVMDSPNNTNTGDFNLKAGDLELVYGWAGAVKQDADTMLITGDGATVAGGSVFKGDLNPNREAQIGEFIIDGDAELDGATYWVTLNDTDSDLVTINGNVTAKDTTINVVEWDNGTYTILTADSGLALNGFKPDVLYNGGALTGRKTAELDVDDINDPKQLILITSNEGNIYITWNANTDIWKDDSSMEHWMDNGGDDETFVTGDSVIFNSGSTGDVTVADGGVTTSGMVVEDGNFTFIGGAITGDKTVTGDKITNPTGKLEVKGGNVTFQNTVDFSDGMTIAVGGMVTLDNDGTTTAGSFDADMEIANAGELAFNIDTASNTYTQDGKLTGSGEFIKHGAGTLIIANQGNTADGIFTHNDGTVRLDYNWDGVYNQEANGTLVTGANSSIGKAGETSTLKGTIDVAGNSIGTLTILGGATLQNTNYNVTLGNALTGETDKLVITGVADVNDFGSINITTWEKDGTYTIMTAASGLNQVDFDNTIIMVGGQDITGSRYNVVLAATGTVVTLTTSATNMGLYWTNGSGNWDYALKNWNDQDDGLGADEIFVAGDYATFTTMGAGTVNISIAKVQTSGMIIEGGQYTFTGGEITGEIGDVGGIATDGELQIAGTADVTFQNSVAFEEGMTVASGAKVTLANDGTATAAGSFADDMAIANEGQLTFNIANDTTAYTQTGAISGAGTVVKTGSGSLELVGSHSGTSFTHSAGELVLSGDWTGAYSQAANATLSSASGSVTGNATLAGITVIENANGKLTVSGTLTMTSATLQLTVAANNASGQIVAGDLAASGNNTVDIDAFIGGTYLIIAGNGYNAANEAAFGALTINGTALNDDRKMVQFDIVTGGLQMTLTDLGGSANLVWGGTLPGNNNWNNDGDKNWDRGDGTLIAFGDRDYATFTDEPTVAKTVNVDDAAGVTTSGMIITGGDYTFTGNKISGTLEPGDYTGATGALDVTNDATAIFENEVAFENGLNIKDTATVTLHNDGNTTNGAFDKDMTVAVGDNTGLIFDIEGSANSYAQEGKITGSGDVTKIGDGTLVVDNAANDNTGDFLHQQGTVNLVYDWAGAYKQDAGATLVSGVDTTVGGGSSFSGILNPNDKNDLGTLTINGNATFTDVTYLVTLDSPSDADLVDVKGAISGSLGALDIYDFNNGTYTIMSAVSGMSAFDISSTVITVGGAAITAGDRFGVTLSIAGDTALQLKAEVASLELYWNHGSGQWNYTNTNWDDARTSGDPITFLPTDYAIFTANGSGTVDVMAPRVQVSGMVIESGSNYTFTGGEIYGKEEAGGSAVTATGKLEVQANANVEFQNAVDFSDGMDIAGGAIVAMTTDGGTTTSGAFADGMAISNEGRLFFNINDTATYTQAGLISGTGHVDKTGTGTLILQGNQKGGIFTHSAGNVEVTYAWGGDYYHNAGQLTTGAYATIGANYAQASGSVFIAGEATEIIGNAALSGTTSIDGSLKIGGNLTLTAATLNMDIAATNVSEVINVTGTLAVSSGTATTINLNQWINGVYIVATTQANGITGTDNIDVTVAGGALGKRKMVEVSVVGSNNEQLQLALKDGASIEITWTGKDDNKWNNDETGGNWNDGVEDTYFADKDKVIFDNTSPVKDIEVDDDGVTVSDMVVDGGDYTFDGGAIAGKPDTNGSLPGTGSLHVTGNGSATFENEAVFEGGATVDAGSELAVIDDGTNPVGLGDTEVGGQGDLYFNIYDDDTSHTHTGKITDQINVIKDGEGTLVVGNAGNDSTGNFTQNDGTVDLEYGWGGNYIQTGGSLVTGDGAVIAGNVTLQGDLNPAGEANLGELTINGNTTTFDDATYIVSIGPGNTADKVIVNSNTINFGPGSLNVDIALWENGTNIIMETPNVDMGAAGYNPSAVIPTINGQVVTSSRITADLEYVTGSGNKQLALTTYVENLGLYWTKGDGAWNNTNTDWNDARTAGNAETFLPNDYAIFTANGSGTVAVNPGGVQTSGMVVEAGGNYTFTGGAIVGVNSANMAPGSSISAATGRLDIESGSNVAFGNSIEFVNGVNVASGATVTMNSGASFTNSSNVVNNGTLVYSKGYDYAIEVAITGTGNIVQEGTDGKLLTLNCATTSTGTFTQRSGNVMLNTTWNGNYVMTSDSDKTTLYAADAATISGDATFGAGEIDLRTSAPSTLTINGNLQMNGGTTLTVALYDTGAGTTGNDKLSVGNDVAFSGSVLNTVNVYSWTDGEYVIIAAAGTIQNNAEDFFGEILYNGMSIGTRQDAELEQRADGIYLVTATSSNLDLIWTGNTDGNWNTTTDNNWKDSDTGDVTKYNPNDYVIFDETGKNQTVTVGGTAVEVAGMEINGGNYTYNGGDIIGKDIATSNGQTVTGALEVTAGSGTFNNHIDFEKGVIIRDGAAVIITDKGSIADTTGVTNEGVFSVAGDTTIASLGGEGGTVLFTNTAAAKFKVTGTLSGSQTFSPIYVNMNTGVASNTIYVDKVEGSHMLNLVGTGDINAGVADILPTIVISTNTATGVINSNSFEFGINNYSAQTDDSKNWKLVKSGYSTTAQAIINTAGSISNSWFAQSDNLLKRMGDMRLAKYAQNQGNFWARPYAMGLNGDMDINGVSKFRERMYGMDFGMDFIAGGGMSGMYTFGGFFGYGHTNRKFRDGYRSDGETESIYGGLYAVYADADGWFIDAVLKGQRFDNEFTSRGDKGDFNAYGLGLSVEVGKKMMLDNDWFLEPTLKAEYAHLFMDSYTTSNGLRVRTSDADIFRLSGALRLAGEWELDNGGVLQPYVKVGFEAQTSTGNKVRMAGERFKPNMDGVRGVFGAGLVWQVDEDVQIHADYEGSFGKKYDMMYNVNLGVRVTF